MSDVAGRGRAIRVLLVEDSPTYAALVRASLSRHKDVEFRVHQADRLDEAIELLDGQAYDVIVLDLWLPDAFGLSTFTRLQDKTSSTPIVVLTGLDDRSVGIHAVTLGAQDYLVKGEADTELMGRSLLYAIERHRARSARDQFFAAISHEFRTPLFAILGHAELLTDPDVPDLEEIVHEYAGTIRSLAQELLAHVNEILDLSKLIAGSLTVDLEEVSPHEIVDDVVKAMAPMARSAGLELLVDVPPGCPAMLADRERVRQVILNLVSNAIKYTPPGGHVVITAIESPDWLVTTVADTGVGIPPDALSHVFEPFYQVPGVEAQKGQASTGLGLALTKRLVEAMQGSISVSSAPGKGTEFTFTVPIAQRRAAQGPGEVAG